MVSRHLQPFGCQIIEAADGQEGVSVAKKERPDLVLLDVTMPVMDGRQALVALRADAVTKSIPVIMLTAESSQELVSDLLKLGVQGYIVKPFAPDKFEQAVAKVLGPPAALGASTRALDAGAVLVVDDSERIVEAARVSLEPVMKVVTATSGTAAIERYVEARPAVVIIDLAMPDMDGIQTLAGIRKSGGTDSYCIALVVRGDQAARDQAMGAGFAEVVEKPFQGAALQDAVAARVMAQGGSPVRVVDGCPIVAMPGPSGKAFGLFKPTDIVRSLAENGHDRLVLDLTQLREPHLEATKVIVALFESAAGMGLRVAVCAPSKTVVANLKGFQEASAALYAETCDAARQQLG
jgi:two-component system cell cycle response regulator